MGHQFSVVLSREITDEESATLREAGCAGATFATGSHPTNPDIIVTTMDFDDPSSPSLAEAIESTLEAVKKVPDLSAAGLNVPAQPTESGQPLSGEPEVTVTEDPTVKEPVTELAGPEDSVDGKPAAPTADLEPTVATATEPELCAAECDHPLVRDGPRR